MPRYADTWVDPALALTPEGLAMWSYDGVRDAKLAILADDGKRLNWAARIPRRLGAVDGASLAQDKHRLRKGTHLCIVLYNLWSPDNPLGTPEADKTPPDLRSEGARLDWELWKSSRIQEAEEDCRKNVTAVLQLGDRPMANRLARLYEYELAQMSRLA